MEPITLRDHEARIRDLELWRAAVSARLGVLAALGAWGGSLAGVLLSHVLG